MSVLREDDLVFALGDPLAVPLGSSVSAGCPRDLIEEAQKVFRRRDPSYEMRTFPIEIAACGESILLPGTRRELTSHGIFVAGHVRQDLGPPPLFLAIWRKGLCPATGASLSVQLLAADGLCFGKEEGEGGLTDAD
jgi:hypothetical protein